MAGKTRIILCVFILALTTLAQTPAPTSNGSISGTVRDAETGLPMQGRTVSISLGSAQNVETDLHGRYKLPDLPPGRYSLQVEGEDLVQEPTSVALASGQDLTSLDFAVSLLGSISGRVTDQDDQPIAGAWVLLLTKAYRNGELRNGQTSFATTDSQGRYKLYQVVTGRAYTVMTKTQFREIPAISQAPDDPAKRTLALTPTYYPNSAFAESAQTITLHSGQNLEDVDIRAKRGQSYCAEGVLEAGGEPAALDFEINDSQTVNSGDGISGGATILPARGRTGPDGKFRICDLHPDDYHLTVRLAGEKPGGPSRFYADVPLLIENRDIKGMHVNAIPGLGLSGEVVWDGNAPPQAADAKIRINLQTIDRLSFPGGAESSIPGRFTIDNLVLGEYAVRISNVPPGSYVKDVTYGGISVLRAALRFGSAAGNAGLRVILARDGGAVSAKVADKDGKPLLSAGVWIVPESARMPAEWAAIWLPTKTDETGVYTSGTLAPGKYVVFATTARFDRSAADIDKLWGVHLQGQEVEVPPSGVVQVNLEPIPVF